MPDPRGSSGSPLCAMNQPHFTGEETKAGRGSMTGPGPRARGRQSRTPLQVCGTLGRIPSATQKYFTAVKRVCPLPSVSLSDSEARQVLPVPR